MSAHKITLADLDGLDLEDFDPAEYITSDVAAAAYINEALSTNDAALLASAIGDVARARGMSDIAKKAGITREALYKALRENSQPRMETIARVLGAMKLRFVVVPCDGDACAEHMVSTKASRASKVTGRTSAEKASILATKPATKKVAA